MATQQKTKDVIYSWVDESGYVHYGNHKVPVQEEAQKPPHAQPLPDQIGQIKTAKVVKPFTTGDQFSKGIQNAASSFLPIVVTLFLLCFITLYLKNITKRKRGNNDEKIPVVNFIFQINGILRLFPDTIEKIREDEKKWRRRDQAPEIIIAEKEKSYFDDIAIDETTKGDKSPEVSRPTPSWTLEFLRSLEWREFEKLCAVVMHEKGFRAELGKGGRDGGIDIHLYQQDEPGKIYAVAQCKAQRQNIKIETVRAFRGAMAANKINKGFFFTAGNFYKQAREFGEAEKIEMISGEDLLQAVKEFPREKQTEILSEIVETDYTTPVCANCGIKMAKKANKETGKEFWGCSNYPKCSNTLNLRWTDFDLSGKDKIMEIAV